MSPTTGPEPERRLLVIGVDAPLAAALHASRGLAGSIIDTCRTGIEAVSRLTRRAYGVVITSAETTVDEDLLLLAELRRARPGVKVIVLAPVATPEDVLAALRARVFACYGAPLDLDEIVAMTARALRAEDWREGIELLSARPDWISLRVNCSLLEADRLTHFMNEIRTDLPDSPRGQLIFGFREVLINAMEHGAGFDPEKVIEVAAVRTARTIVYYFRDPGHGFRLEEIPHSALSNPPGDPLAHVLRREEAGMRPGGFGLLIAKRVVDEMMFSESGNEVLLIKHTA